MKLRTWFTFLCALSVSSLMAQSAGQSQSPSSAMDAFHMQQPALTPFEQQLLDTQKALLDAMKRGDTAYLGNALANDFVVIAPNGDTAGKGDLLEYAVPHKGQKELPQPQYYDWKVVQLADNAAVVTFNVVYPTYVERYQHLSNTWVKEGNQWKLKFQQTTLNLWSAHDL